MTRRTKTTKRMTLGMAGRLYSLWYCAHDSSVADFIDERPGDEPISHDDTVHRRLNRNLGRADDVDAEEIAAAIRKRHRQEPRYNADSDSIPQRLLMPSVNDPSLWSVRCKVGARLGQLLTFIARARKGYPCLGLSQSLSIPGQRQPH